MPKDDSRLWAGPIMGGTDYGRDRLWAGPIMGVGGTAGDSCHWRSFTLPSAPSDGMLPPQKRNTCHPSDKQRPNTRTHFLPSEPPHHHLPITSRQHPTPREFRHHLTPISRQRPAQRDISVTMSRTALTDTPPSETHTSPPDIRLSLTPHQRDVSVTAPHGNSRQPPAPRDTSVTNPTRTSHWHRPRETFPSPTHTRLSPEPNRRRSRPRITAEKRKTLRRWNSGGFVELMVIETTTSSMRTKRSTN